LWFSCHQGYRTQPAYVIRRETTAAGHDTMIVPGMLSELLTSNRCRRRGKDQPMVSSFHSLAWLTAWLAVIGSAWAQSHVDKEKAAKGSTASKAAKKSPTAKVEKGPFRVEASLKGVFESGDMKEILITANPQDGQPLPPLRVLKVVEHGAVVKKGDTLIEFDFEKIDHAIKDLREDCSRNELALHLAEKELPILEQMTPLDLGAAERAKKHADEDLERFLRVDRAMAEEKAKNWVDNAEFFVKSAEEELKQLQKMYRDKDLTEETEEFILKRQKHEVKQAQIWLKHARIESEETLKVQLPRQEVNLHENAAKKGLDWEKANTTLRLALDQRRLAAQKLKSDLAKSSRHLQDLEEYRKAMVVKSPADGIVYHGKCVRGEWMMEKPAPGAPPRLERYGHLTPDIVFMTIVSPRPLFVRASVEEKDLHFLKPDIKGNAVPVGYPDLKLPARVTQVSYVPHTPGNFEARFAIDAVSGHDMIKPGMACKIKFTGYKKEDALLAQSTAVFSEDGDEDAHYVYLAGKGSPQKQTVEIGKKSGGKTEILAGLKEGDEILTSKPENKP